jgi:hypothetical protein
MHINGLKSERRGQAFFMHDGMGSSHPFTPKKNRATQLLALTKCKELASSREGRGQRAFPEAQQPKELKKAKGQTRRGIKPATTEKQNDTHIGLDCCTPGPDTSALQRGWVHHHHHRLGSLRQCSCRTSFYEMSSIIIGSLVFGERRKGGTK